MQCDIRWSNIVWVWGEWYVIDCTEAIRCDAGRSTLLEKSNKIKENYVFDTEKPWSTRHDYYQLGMLIYCRGVDIKGADLFDLHVMLTEKSSPQVDIDHWKTVLGV
jgi:hypothetical protein